MTELRQKYLHQSEYDKKITINLRNSHVLKKNRRLRPRSKLRESREKSSHFAPSRDNSVEVSQNFSMVKGKSSGLNYSVVGHSQFVNFDEEQFKKESQTSNEVPEKFFPRRQRDYLDKVLDLDYSSPKRSVKKSGTPKFHPDLVEMVKGIFGTDGTSTQEDFNFTSSLFQPSPSSLRRQNQLFNLQPNNMSFNYMRPKQVDNGLKIERPKPIFKRRYQNQIDCSDVLQHIRQRQLYRRPLQLFQRN